MSSHHIVKEKQEPALLIMDLTDFDEENLGQLLEWSPTLIVAENQYEKVDSLGIKVDIIVGNSADLEYQESTLVIHSEDDPLTNALNYLIDERYPSVNIIDTNFCIETYLPFRAKITLVVLTPKYRTFAINSGFSKWKSANEEISLFEDLNNLKTTGLIQKDKRNYITEKDGFYTLTFDQPFTFITERI